MELNANQRTKSGRPGNEAIKGLRLRSNPQRLNEANIHHQQMGPMGPMHGTQDFTVAKLAILIVNIC